MQNRMTFAFGLSTLLLGAICLAQWRQGATHKEQIASLQKASSEAAKTVESQQGKIRKAERQRAEAIREVSSPGAQGLAPDLNAPSSGIGGLDGNTAAAGLSGSNKSGRGTTAGDREGNGRTGLSDMLTKMLDDPEMRKTMAEQQRMAMKMMYGDLFKELNMTGEEQAKLSDLMVGFQMKNMENARALMEEGPARDAATQLQQQQKVEHDQEVKTLLGDERYAQFEDYNQNIGNRMLVNQVKGELAGSKTPLKDEQTKQLVQLMREETDALARDSNFNSVDHTTAGQQWDTALSEDAMEKYFDRQAQVNQRVLERAQTLLSPEQLAVLGNHQTNQISMQRMGMKMARSMMGKKEPALAAP